MELEIAPTNDLENRASDTNTGTNVLTGIALLSAVAAAVLTYVGVDIAEGTEKAGAYLSSALFAVGAGGFGVAAYLQRRQVQADRFYQKDT